MCPEFPKRRRSKSADAIPSTSPTHVLFDLDGVLIHYDHDARLRMLAERSGTCDKAVSAALFGSGLEAEADLGKYDTLAQIAESTRRLGAKISLEDCVAARQSATAIASPVLELAQQVSQRAHVAILTNNGLMLRDHLPTICPPLFPLFSGRIFCSAQYGATKPDPTIFHRCLTALDAAPERTLFIDDKAENATAARGAGLLAHHYRDPASLRAELHAFGLLEPNDDAP